MASTQGSRVKEVRRYFKLSQEDLSGRIGIRQSSVSQIEKDGSASAETLLKISEAYGVNIGWLMRGEGEMLITKEKPEEKNIQPALTSEKVWQEMAIKQMKTIADLVTTNKLQAENINSLSAEISLLNRQREPVKL